MEYSKLSKKAKEKAIADYQKGWLETHPNDPMDKTEIDDILTYDLTDYTYKKDGSLLSVE